MSYASLERIYNNGIRSSRQTQMTSRMISYAKYVADDVMCEWGHARRRSEAWVREKM